MEKLIELLNEYNKERTNGELGWREWSYYEDGGYILYGEYNGGTFSEMYCISKRYGFIKWLVDNDKIDKEKVWKNESPDIFDYSFYEVVLMLLSIQDNPIEFLISVLK